MQRRTRPAHRFRRAGAPPSAVAWAFEWAALAALAPLVRAQEPPPIRSLRQDEDYSYVLDPDRRTGAWWEALKHAPHRPGDLHATFGAELRARYEAHTDDLWGGASPPDHDGWWLRTLPYADVRWRDVRAFVQLVAAVELDDEAGKAPPDENRADVQQAFADATFAAGGATTLTARAGRQALAYGSERLISTRYGLNVLQSFDTAAVRAAGDGWRLDLLYGRPVDHRPGTFDDATSETESLWLAYATFDLPGERAGLDLYTIGSEDELAVYDQGAGEAVRQTLGARWFGAERGIDWNFELFGQLGRFAGGDVRAWSVASDTGYTFEHAPLRPRVGLKANAISGDEDPLDEDLETFDPLFPKGKYFGENGLIGPYNLLNLHPSAEFELAPPWRLGLGAAVYWRQSAGDGVYDNAGNVLRSAAGSDERFIGTQVDVLFTFAPDRTFDASFSWSAFFAGSFLSDTGPDETVHFASFEVRFVF